MLDVAPGRIFKSKTWPGVDFARLRLYRASAYRVKAAPHLVIQDVDNSATKGSNCHDRVVFVLEGAKAEPQQMRRRRWTNAVEKSKVEP